MEMPIQSDLIILEHICFKAFPNGTEDELKVAANFFLNEINSKTKFKNWNQHISFRPVNSNSSYVLMIYAENQFVEDNARIIYLDSSQLPLNLADAYQIAINKYGTKDPTYFNSGFNFTLYNFGNTQTEYSLIITNQKPKPIKT